MPLSGTFDTIQLCDLMQWIHAGNMTGTLTVSLDEGDTYLVIQHGTLVALASDDPLRLDLGQVLLKQELINEQQLDHALNKAQSKKLAEVLTEEGILEKNVVTRIQQQHVFESVLDLFFHEEGSFFFSPGKPSNAIAPPPEISRSNFLTKPIPINELVFEGMQRLDEWDNMRKIFPNSYVVVYALQGESENQVWRKLRQTQQPVSIGELCLRMGTSRYAIYRDLYDAYHQGLIQVDLNPTKDAEQSALGPTDMLIQNARLLLLEKQYDEARAVLSTAANLDPTNQEARKLLKRTRESQLEYLYQQVPPHRVPVLNISLEQLSRIKLSPRENYLTSRLNGRWDVASLVVLTPLGELETLKILHKLLHAGIIIFLP